MEQVTDPQGRPLKPRVPILHFLEFGGHLSHYLHAEGVTGRAPNHGLRGSRHHRPKHGKLFGHCNMVEGRKPHPLKQVLPHLWGTNDGMTQVRTPGL
jgi:hypothetical protein